MGAIVLFRLLRLRGRCRGLWWCFRFQRGQLGNRQHRQFCFRLLAHGSGMMDFLEEHLAFLEPFPGEGKISTLQRDFRGTKQCGGLRDTVRKIHRSFPFLSLLVAEDGFRARGLGRLPCFCSQGVVAGLVKEFLGLCQ